MEWPVVVLFVVLLWGVVRVWRAYANRLPRSVNVTVKDVHEFDPALESGEVVHEACYFQGEFQGEAKNDFFLANTLVLGDKAAMFKAQISSGVQLELFIDKPPYEVAKLVAEILYQNSDATVFVVKDYKLMTE